MSDAALIETCARALSAYSAAMSISGADGGALVSKADWELGHQAMSRFERNADMAAETPAVTLAGWRAKAAVLLVAEHEALNVSLLQDILKL